MRPAITIFYLILRGLDTIEDDMELDNAIKLPLLRGFKAILESKDWTFDQSSEKEKDRVVLVEFDTVLTEYHELKPAYKEIISDITDRMGKGMADYIGLEQQKNYQGVKTIADYDLYCHHVAGIVGEGLTRMAVYSGFGTKVLSKNENLQESMGLFLQKTNIIRDYREDIDDGRSFWPKEVWSKYTTSLPEFAKPENEQQGLFCVSDLATLSLRHVTDCLEYLQNITEPTLFSFCAIPQVMSIATLSLVFNNPRIFHENVKIRRGLAAKLILDSQTMSGVFDIFKDYTRQIHLQNHPKDPNFMRIEVLCGRIEQYIEEHDPKSLANTAKPVTEAEVWDKENILIVVAGASGLIFTFGVMIFVAWLFGARFDVVNEEIKGIVNSLLGGEIPEKFRAVHDEL